MKDDTIIAAIQTGQKGQMAITTFFEQNKLLVNGVASKYKLSKEERQSAYADAVIAVVNSVKQGKYKGEASLKTYLSRIFNYKCIDLCNKNSTIKARAHDTVWIDEMFHLSSQTKSVVKKMMDRELVADLMRKLELIGEKCKQLMLAVGQQYNYTEIAKTLGYKDANTVKSKKYKCLQKLLQL